MTGARAGRRVFLLALASLGGGCAQVEAPPGGPEDKAPPELVVVRPDSVGRLPPGREPVVFVFDERLSEQTATNRPIAEAVLVSPRTSPVRVEKRGSELRVELRQGWEPGRIYHVTLTPGIRDLFGNRLTETVRAVLSTGPEIPDTRLTGTVVSRITGRPERDARVEAILRADSSVYALPSDSAGAFRFERIPEGEYLVRAYPDANRNREPDFFEAQDTATVTVAAAAAAPSARLRLLAPDTTAPKLASGSFTGSALRLQFDDHLDPEQPVAPGQVTVTAADGAALPVSRVNLGEPPRADTAGAEDRPDGAPARGAPPARADTAGPREPLPVQLVTVELAAPPVEGVDYRVTATGFRNLHGAAGGGELTLRGPAPTAPAGAEGEEPDSVDAPPGPRPDSAAGPAAESAAGPPVADPAADSAAAALPRQAPAEDSPGEASPGEKPAGETSGGEAPGAEVPGAEAPGRKAPPGEAPPGAARRAQAARGSGPPEPEVVGARLGGDGSTRAAS